MSWEVYVALGGALCVWLLIRYLAHQDNLLGHICRFFWNLGFMIAAMIPFCGWMARFIIDDDEESKKEWIEIGDASDEWGAEMLESAAERERLEQKKKDQIREEIAHRYGGTSVSVSSDFKSATYQDKYGKTHEVDVRWTE